MNSARDGAMDPNYPEAGNAAFRGVKGDCPICGHPYDNHVRGECPEDIKARLELATRVLERYVPRARARMQMALDIARLEYLMSLYKGAK